MPPITLPGRDDGSAGLLALADALGDEYVFKLIRTCRTVQGRNNPGGDTLTILARRVVRQTMAERPDLDEAEARKDAAVKLGYPDWKARSNFSKVIDREPFSEGHPDLLRLADEHGDIAVFDMIRLARAWWRAGDDPGRDALHLLAKRLVHAQMRHTGDESSAITEVAERLGYTSKYMGNGVSNFRQIYLSGGRRPETRPPASRGRTR